MRTWRAPLGSLAPPAAPASEGNSLTLAGMSITNQCHQPEPVGASGSYTVMAKLFASAGAPLQRSVGDLLSPVQPKPLNSKLLGISASAAKSGLDRTKPPDEVVGLMLDSSTWGSPDATTVAPQSARPWACIRGSANGESWL